ncbi:MAG: AraC family transcriptional regulator [Rhodococcus sp.]|nr:AraC family transcriptional regulator [Rhodococcus sp. (in: high G+C Gram-positive bacteria)]
MSQSLPDGSPAPDSNNPDSNNPESVSDIRKYAVEAFGTFVLVFVGVGVAVFAGNSVGNFGVAFAFGTTLLVLIYTLRPISGCHVNPAVTLGHYLLGRIPTITAVGYWIAQVVGGLVAGLVIFAIANSLPSYNRGTNGLAANGWGEHSPSAVIGPLGDVLQGGYGIGAAMVVEIVLTALFVFIFLAAMDRIAIPALSGVVVGATFALVYLFSIPIDYGAANPARSIAVAFYQDGAFLQLWLFILFPLIGGVIGAFVYRAVFQRTELIAL